MRFEEHIPLGQFTTFRIGGNARYFVRVQTDDELRQAILFAHDQKLPIFILGGGSNILVSDQGFEGVVIKVEIRGLQTIDKDAATIEVIAGAGENWDDLVRFAVEHDLYGLENLSLIPGSVGAAPVQNIGAYGTEVKSTISFVDAFNYETAETRTFSNKECAFEYRDSFFKTQQGKKYVITHVHFLLKKEAIVNTDYKDISDYIKINSISELNLKTLRNIVVDIRTKKLPDTHQIGTAGSFFKNPILQKTQYEKVKVVYPDIPMYEVDEARVKVSAAWILDNVCGFKGYKEGNIGVYKNQALVLINFGGGNATEIKNLAQKMITCVYDKTGISLETEVQYI